jgi:hypothetical protein
MNATVLGRKVKQKMMETRLQFDVAVMQQQIANLTGLALAKFPEGLPEHLVGELRRLGSDLVFGDLKATTSADGLVEILYPVRFGAHLEGFASALGTAERNGLCH